MSTGDADDGAQDAAEEDGLVTDATPRWWALSTAVALPLAWSFPALVAAEAAGAATMGSVGPGALTAYVTGWLLCVVYAVGPGTYKQFVEARNEATAGGASP